MLSIKNLFKSFGPNQILKGINLEVQKGEVIVIIGPSGSGKSTLLRCINGLEKSSSGEIISQTTKIGMVFQHFNLFNNKTVLDNLTYAPINVLNQLKDIAEKKAHQLLNQIGLDGKHNTYPSKLSGGQKQRTAIMRALMMQPDIILFDEPTSSLDPEMVKEVLDLIKSLAKSGITILMNTHEIAFAREVAHKIVFLDHGKILDINTPDKFFQNQNIPRIKSFLDKVLY